MPSVQFAMIMKLIDADYYTKIRLNYIYIMQSCATQLAVGVLKVRLCDNGQSNELQDLRELYRKEALQRKLLYNKVYY